MACSPTKGKTLNVKHYQVRTDWNMVSREESAAVWIEQNCTSCRRFPEHLLRTGIYYVQDYVENSKVTRGRKEQKADMQMQNILNTTYYFLIY